MRGSQAGKRRDLAWLDGNVKVGDYHSICIIGHSAGGVLAQAAYLLSRKCECGLGTARAQQIRLILIAPMRRGWTISHHLPLPHKIAWTVGQWLIPLVKLRERFRSARAGRKAQQPWVMQLRRGAPFLVWLRLAWLRLTERPVVFLLLGSVDELISWRDMIDEVNSGDDAVHLQVAHSDHAQIIDFENGRHGAERAQVLIAALTQTPTEARALPHYVEPWDPDPARPDESVKRVVFVIHGIRDEGHWTQKIAARACALRGSGAGVALPDRCGDEQLRIFFHAGVPPLRGTTAEDSLAHGSIR